MFFCGCQSISKEEAEQTALIFLHENVKFYAKGENTTTNVQRYNMEVVDSYKDGNYWNFIVRVSSTMGNETKQAKMRVVVDAKTNKIASFDPKAE